MALFNISRTIIAGDGNIHLSEVVEHTPGCRCLHCKQSAVDRSIEKLLAANGLHCTNPVNSPTHVSLTSVDVFLTERVGHFSTVYTTSPGAVGQSDHSFVHTMAPLTTDCSYAAGFGRVIWSSSSMWVDALAPIDPYLHRLSEVVAKVSSVPVAFGLSQ